MPLVHIDMMKGRSPEKIERMIAAVSEAIADTLDTPISTVRIVINEMEPHQYGIAGKPYPVVVEERRRAPEAGR